MTLKIIPIVYADFYEELKLPSGPVLNEIKLGFFDGAEKEIYDNLLDDSKDKFELIFEKEKVNFYIDGAGAEEQDDTKVEIDYFSIGSNASLEIFFRPQFTGIVKITNKDNKEKPNKDKSNGGGNNDNGGGNNNDKNDPAIQAKINNLQNQISALEEKLRNQPTSNTNQQDEQELARLKGELEELKKKQKDKSQNKGHNQKDNFPTGLVVGGGIVIFLLLIAVIFF